jgi:hypothetical protein
MHRLSFPFIVSFCLLTLPLSAHAEPAAISPSEAPAAHMEKGHDAADFTR